MPLLEEVLAAYGHTIRLAIEIKTDAPDRLERVAAALVAQLARHRPRAVTITSFDPVAHEIVRRLVPEIPRAFIGAYDTPAFLETALQLGCRQADVPLRTGSVEVVHEAQAAGLRVVGWLGNSEEDLEALVRWGVDGITTDYPTRARAFLEQRGVPVGADWD